VPPATRCGGQVTTLPGTEILPRDVVRTGEQDRCSRGRQRRAAATMSSKEGAMVGKKSDGDFPGTGSRTATPLRP